MRNNAQGAIEYLLIIGAAILIVSVVIVAISGGLAQGKAQGNAANAENNSQMMKLNCANDCTYYGPCTDAQSCKQFSNICVPSTVNSAKCIKK